MERSLAIAKSSRNILLQILEKCSLEQLNKVPDGFNNNIIWNVAHIIVVQQMLVYKLSGLPMLITDEFVEKYKRGTRPQNDVTSEELENIKILLHAALEQTSIDYTAAIFKSYQSFVTMSGFTLKDAVSAMEFNNYHEGVHTGVIMAIRKFI